MNNLFKKSNKKGTKVTIQKIDKIQLEKITGGVDSTFSVTD